MSVIWVVAESREWEMAVEMAKVEEVEELGRSASVVLFRYPMT